MARTTLTMQNLIDAGVIQRLRRTGLITETGHLIGSVVSNYGTREPVDTVLDSDGNGGVAVMRAGVLRTWQPEVTHATDIEPRTMVYSIYEVELPEPVPATLALARLDAYLRPLSSFADREVINAVAGREIIPDPVHEAAKAA